jgi:hypothetical protein
MMALQLWKQPAWRHPHPLLVPLLLFSSRLFAREQNKAD